MSAACSLQGGGKVMAGWTVFMLFLKLSNILHLLLRFNTLMERHPIHT